MRRIASLARAFLLSGALLVAACAREESSGPPREGPLVPDQVIQNFSVTESGEGRKEWVLEAEEARVYDRIGETRADSLRVRFFRKEDGACYSTLRADAGRIDQATKDVTASGNVVVVTDEGYRLEAPSLTWIQKTGRIRTDDAIRLRKGNHLLTGTGFESDPSLSQYQIRSDVKAWIVDEKGHLEESP